VGRRLVLVAVARHNAVLRGVEELGDALYVKDPDVSVEAEHGYPLIYVFSPRLGPWEAFRAVVREPPAYIERLVPVEHLARDVDELVEFIARRAEEMGVREFWLELHGRGFGLPRGRRGERDAVKEIVGALAGRGFRVVRRRGVRVFVVEDTRYGIVAAGGSWGFDRIRFWREERLDSGL